MSTLATIQDRAGYIYVIKADETFFDGRKFYKIGHTKKLRGRMKTFEVKLPFKFELIVAGRMSDRVDAEACIHERYEHRRVNGEWFELSDGELNDLRLWVLSVEALELCERLGVVFDWHSPPTALLAAIERQARIVKCQHKALQRAVRRLRR